MNAVTGALSAQSTGAEIIDLEAYIDGIVGISCDANLKVALDLAERAFAVFPVRDWGDGDGWKPIRAFQDKASSDLAQIRSWWTAWPDARVGLLAGKRNDLIVLDLDVKNEKDGVAALADLGFSDLAALSPVRVRTPSGGWHLFFRYDPRLRNSVSKIGSGIDLKTEGGFVVAPGSFKDNRCYRVVGSPLGSVELPQFPESLMPSPQPDRGRVEIVTNATAYQIEWATDYLNELAASLAATPEGARNDTLNRAAMWAGGAAAHGFLTDDAVHRVLWAAAEVAGMRPSEFRSTFKSGWEAGLRKPITGFPPHPDVFDDLEELPELERTQACDPVTARLNRRHAVVVVRGKTLITTEHRDGVDFGSVRDLHSYYENDRVPVGETKTEAASRRWLRDPARRTFANGVTFAPGGSSDETLNLWREWAVASFSIESAIRNANSPSSSATLENPSASPPGPANMSTMANDTRFTPPALGDCHVSASSCFDRRDRG